MQSHAEPGICVRMPLTLYHSVIKSKSAISLLRYAIHDIRNTRLVTEEIVLRHLLTDQNRVVYSVLNYILGGQIVF